MRATGAWAAMLGMSSRASAVSVAGIEPRGQVERSRPFAIRHACSSSCAVTRSRLQQALGDCDRAEEGQSRLLGELSEAFGECEDAEPADSVVPDVPVRHGQSMSHRRPCHRRRRCRRVRCRSGLRPSSPARRPCDGSLQIAPERCRWNDGIAAAQLSVATIRFPHVEEPTSAYASPPTATVRQLEPPWLCRPADK